MSGISFQWTDGLFGMALAPTGDGYSTLYFHPLSSSMEFSVTTKLLRDPKRATSSGKCYTSIIIFAENCMQKLICVLRFRYFKIFISIFRNLTEEEYRANNKKHKGCISSGIGSYKNVYTAI